MATPPFRVLTPVYLTGYMGAGKTTIGRELSRQLACPFFDLDNVIESKHKRSIVEIFTNEGEENFRLVELESLRNLLMKDGRFVLALGGGSLLTEEARILVENRKMESIYLCAPVEELWRRCTDKTTANQQRVRPLVALGETAFRERFLQREQNYKCAKFTIETIEKSIDQVITDCMVALQAI
jgi:shikimate kinase